MGKKRTERKEKIVKKINGEKIKGFWKDIVVIMAALASFSLIFNLLFLLADGSMLAGTITKNTLFISAIMFFFMGLLAIGVYESLFELGAIRRDRLLLFISVFFYASVYGLALGEMNASIAENVPSFLEGILKFFLASIELGIVLWGIDRIKNALSRDAKRS